MREHHPEEEEGMGGGSARGLEHLGDEAQQCDEHCRTLGPQDHMALCNQWPADAV